MSFFTTAQIPDLITYSDLASAVATALQMYAHGGRVDPKGMAYNALSQAVGRLVSHWLKSMNVTDQAKGILTTSLVDHLVKFSVRYGIAHFLNEKGKWIKAFDSVVDDVLGDALLQAAGIADKGVFSKS